MSNKILPVAPSRICSKLSLLILIAKLPDRSPKNPASPDAEINADALAAVVCSKIFVPTCGLCAGVKISSAVTTPRIVAPSPIITSPSADNSKLLEDIAILVGSVAEEPHINALVLSPIKKSCLAG